MENPRFINPRSSSFFGEFLYDQFVPKDHFQHQLNQVID
jgi:hypothetical protein